LLLVNGWFGGELAYRYGIGAIHGDSPEVERFHAPEPPAAARTVLVSCKPRDGPSNRALAYG
jgi:hypothetical protein